jgi:hypothetical protein
MGLAWEEYSNQILGKMPMSHKMIVLTFCSAF